MRSYRRPARCKHSREFCQKENERVVKTSRSRPKFSVGKSPPTRLKEWVATRPGLGGRNRGPADENQPEPIGSRQGNNFLFSQFPGPQLRAAREPRDGGKRGVAKMEALFFASVLIAFGRSAKTLAREFWAKEFGGRFFGAKVYGSNRKD